MKERKYAGFGLRIWMGLIDIVSYSLFTGILAIIVGHAVELKPNSDINYLVSFIVTVIIPVIITFLLWKYKGGSVGKITRKARIVDIETGNAPTNKQLILRMLGSFLSGFSCFLSYLNVAIDSRKQSWHDKLSGTCVVKNSKLEDYKLTPATLTKKRDKVFTSIGVSIVSLLLIGCAIVGYMALQDEDLLPGAKEFMSLEKIVEENPRDNGFYFLLGFGCKEDEDPHQIGYDWVQRQNKYVSELKIDNVLQRSNNNDKLPSLHTNFRTQLSNINTNTTIDSILTHSTIIESNYKSLDYLLERYNKIGSHSYIKNTITPTTFSQGIDPFNFIDLNILLDYWILKEYNSGNKDSAYLLKDLIRKNNYLFENGSSLMDVFIYEFILNQHLHTLSLILDLHMDMDMEFFADMVDTPNRINWDSIWVYKKREEISMALSLYNFMTIHPQDEYRIQNFINRLSMKYKLKLNKHVNLAFKSYKRMISLSRLDGVNYHNSPKIEYKFEYDWFKVLLDPLGETMKVNVDNILGGYVGKEHKLHGLFSLLKLKIMILDQRIATEDIPTFLRKQVATYYNPFTGKAINWDSENSMLYFVRPGYEDEERVELKIILDK